MSDTKIITTKATAKAGLTIKIPSAVKYGDLVLNIQCETCREVSGQVDERELQRELQGIVRDVSIESYKEYKAVLDEFTASDVTLSITLPS